MNEYFCFACGKRILADKPLEADTRDDQIVYVGPECYRKIVRAGEEGYKPKGIGPRLWQINHNQISSE